jgi:hypothetical protein
MNRCYVRRAEMCGHEQRVLLGAISEHASERPSQRMILL